MITFDSFHMQTFVERADSHTVQNTTRTGSGTFSSSASPVKLDLSEIRAGGESTPLPPLPPANHPTLGQSQASARAVPTDVGDITAHQSSFDKSPFDTAPTIVSL